MSNYWLKRQEREQEAITDKTQEEINKQLNKYYRQCMLQVIDDFEATYNKLLATVGSGRPVTVSDLYRLDRYWQLQAQLKQLCQELGDKEIALLSEKFEEQWKEIYESTALTSDDAFTQVSTANAEQMVKSNWVADGKSFSDRIWGNTQDLAVTLNEQLIHCVVTGRSSKDLRKMLQDRFQVSRSRANTLIRTETARIQTESAAQRYEDAGVKQYRILGREEEKGCNHSIDCHKMDGKIFYFKDKQVGKNAPPFHPNCRCRIQAIVDDDILRTRLDQVRDEEKAKRAKQAEARKLQEEAKTLRAQAKKLKEQGQLDAAKKIEAQARELERRYKAIYAQLNNKD